MSAYKDAVQAAVNAEHEVWCGAPPSCGLSARRCHEAAVNASDVRERAFLAALPPSITVGELLDAAREVAERERSEA